MVIKAKAKGNGNKKRERQSIGEKVVEEEKDKIIQTILHPEPTVELTPGEESFTSSEEFISDLDRIIESGADSVMLGQKLGVLQRLVTAVLEDKEYRQVLLNAAFDNKHEALLCADAIAECKRYGVNIEWLIDRVIAQCSVKAARVNAVLEAMTKYTLNTNYKGGRRFFNQKNKGVGGLP